MEDSAKTVRAKSLFISEFHFCPCNLSLYKKLEISIRYKNQGEVTLIPGLYDMDHIQL